MNPNKQDHKKGNGMDRRGNLPKGFVFALLWVTIVAVSHFPAGAAPLNETPGVAAPPSPAKSTKVPEEPRRSLQMQELEILGEVEKPKTMFVIPRAPHTYSLEKINKDFTEEILSPIDRQEIEDTQRWRDSTSLP